MVQLCDSRQLNNLERLLPPLETGGRGYGRNSSCLPPLYTRKCCQFLLWGNAIPQCDINVLPWNRKGLLTLGELDEGREPAACRCWTPGGGERGKVTTETSTTCTRTSQNPSIATLKQRASENGQSCRRKPECKVCCCWTPRTGMTDNIAPGRTVLAHKVIAISASGPYPPTHTTPSSLPVRGRGHSHGRMPVYGGISKTAGHHEDGRWAASYPEVHSPRKDTLPFTPLCLRNPPPHHNAGCFKCKRKP